MLSIELISMCYEACMKHTMKRMTHIRTRSMKHVLVAEQKVINSIIRSYFTASGKATAKFGIFPGCKPDLPVFLDSALRRQLP